MAPIVYIKKKRDPDYYYGKQATHYNRKRKKQKVWLQEYEIVESIISRYKPDHVIDIPVGTGRFLPIYKKYNISATGIDISKDMLKQAKKHKTDYELKLGSVFTTPLTGFVVCMRLLNFFTTEEIFSILSRVCGYIVFTLRHTDDEDIDELTQETGLTIVEKHKLKNSQKGDFYIYLAHKECESGMLNPTP